MLIIYKTGLKIFFAYARSKSKCRTETGVLVDDKNDTLDTDKEIVEHFNSYFASVFTHEDYSKPPTPIHVCDFNVTCADMQFDESTVSTSVGRYHGTTVEPRYFFFTVPVPSRSWYYRGTAIPLIPRYYRTVLANK